MHFWSSAGEWCVEERYNHELYKLFNEPHIVKYIKINRLVWAGHVIRMDKQQSLYTPWRRLRGEEV
jgi:hypothetical protein